MYDLEKVETLKYLDLSKSKWRSVEASAKTVLSAVNKSSPLCEGRGRGRGAELCRVCSGDTSRLWSIGTLGENLDSLCLASRCS